MSFWLTPEHNLWFISDALVLANSRINRTCQLETIEEYGNVMFYQLQVIETEHSNKKQVLQGTLLTDAR